MRLNTLLTAARQMGPRWLAARALYEALARSGAYRLRFRPYSEMASDPAETYRGFRRSLVPLLDLERLRAFYRSHPDLRDRRIAAAERVAAGQVEVYDRRFDLSIGSFNTCPMTGGQWPTGVHGAVYPIYQPGLGDVKYAWELNNFHYAPALAQAAVLSDDPGYYKAFKGLVSRWIEENPRQSTVNWSSNLEIGVRLFFWCLTWELFTHAPSFADWSSTDLSDDGFFIRFSRSIHAQLRFMRRHLWVSAECHKMNHVLGDLIFIIYVLSCYPALPERRRLDVLCRHFERELETQFFPDGTYEMASLNYQRYVTEYLLTHLRLRDDLPPEKRKQLADTAWRSVEYLSKFTDDKGESLRFGDNDGAYLLRLGDVPRNNFGPLFLWAQALCGASIAKQYSPGTLEAVAWMNEFPDPLPVEKASPREVEFPHGGYWRYRDERVHLWVRTGRRPPHGAGQADLLSFALSLDGKPVVVQPGTGLYNGPLEMRAYFRGALSHSSVRVDGREPMRPWGRFRYLLPAAGWGRVVAKENDWLAFAGRHTGFDKLGLTYRRAFLVVRGKGLAVLDCLSGRLTHQVERGLHLADPPTALMVAGMERFWPADEGDLGYGRSPSYGEVIASDLLVENTSRELPWMALYYLGCAEDVVRAENEGQGAKLRVGDKEFAFFFRGQTPVMVVSGNGEVELTEGP